MYLSQYTVINYRDHLPTTKTRKYRVMTTFCGSTNPQNLSSSEFKNKRMRMLERDIRNYLEREAGFKVSEKKGKPFMFRLRDAIVLRSVKVQVLRGFSVTCIRRNDDVTDTEQVFLRVDLEHRELYNISILRLLQDWHKNDRLGLMEMNEKLSQGKLHGGMEVCVRYGTDQGDGNTYRLLGFAKIDDEGPLEEANLHTAFSCPVGQLTLAKYVEERYDIPSVKLQGMVLPWVLRAVFSTKEKRLQHERRHKGRAIYLLPQFCFPFTLPEQPASLKDDLKRSKSLSAQERTTEEKKYAKIVREQCQSLFETHGITMEAMPSAIFMENLTVSDPTSLSVNLKEVRILNVSDKTLFGSVT